MKILMIHEHGRAQGSGAVVAMYRLHQGLRRVGVQSTIACRRRQLDAADIVQLPSSPRLENFLGMLSWRMGLNDVHCVSSFRIRKFQPFLDADVINLHGLHTNFFNYLALPGMSKVKPMVMTLHDMWALTGHCSHSHECTRWKTGCGKCPHLDVFPPVGRDATAIEWRLKRWVYRRTPLTIVSPSKWLANLARQSLLADYPIHHVPNGVDIDVYQPRDKLECRRALGIPEDKLIIMFAAAALNNPGKGGDLLREALVSLPASLKARSFLLLVGDRSDAFENTIAIPSKSLGFVPDDESKVKAYSAADIFVLPSRAENHSLVMLEAMACGTPGVAFNVGGNPEIVRHNETGYLATAGSAVDLRMGIATLLENNALRSEMSSRARAIICDEFSLQQHVARYMDIYAQAIRAGVAAEPVAALAPAQ